MAAGFLDLSVQIALLCLSASFLLTVFKVIKGPTLPDRILALDMLVAVAIGYIAVLGIKTGYTLYLDIALALGLVGFLATVAFARFILARGVSEEERIENQVIAEANATQSPHEDVEEKPAKKVTPKRKPKSSAAKKPKRAPTKAKSKS